MDHPRLQFSPPSLLHSPLVLREWTNCHDGRFQLLNLLTESFLEPQSSHFHPCFASSCFRSLRPLVGLGLEMGRKTKNSHKPYLASNLPPVPSTLHKPAQVAESAESLSLQAGHLPFSGVSWDPEPGALLKQRAPVSSWLFGYFLQLLWRWPEKHNPSQYLLSASLKLVADLRNRLRTSEVLEYDRGVWEWQYKCKRDPYLVVAQLWNFGVDLALET